MLGLKYQITNKTLNNIVETTKLTEEIAKKRVPNSEFRKIKRETLAKTAHYSTKIEGNPLTLEQVKSLLDGREIIAKKRAINEVQNYIETIENIENYQSKGRIHLDLLLKMHQGITKGVLENTLACGKLREVQNYIAKGSRIVYTPPPPEKVEAMMKELVKWINSDETKDLNPIIQAGICHYAIAMIHPFEDGNGRVARALATLILKTRGFDPKGIYAIDEYYERDRDAYYKALQQVDKANGNLTSWLEYYADGVLLSIKTIHSVLNSLEKSKDLNQRQKKALKHTIKHGYITNRDYREINTVSNKTAYQDLKEMVKKGILEEKGKGRAKRYVIKT